MALQPIYGDNNEIVDYYDDGTTEDQPEETLEASDGSASPQTWTVPDLLKEVELFIGTTIHHDDDNPQGPLISLFVRELPDGAVTVRTYRAAELSERAFLDNLQKGVAITMQAHLMTKAEQQRRRLEEEAKRKARASSTKTTPAEASAPTKVASTNAPKISTKPSPATTPAPIPERKAPKEAEKKPKYETISMFD